MASGTINVTTSNERITGRISWSSTPNTEGNYSDVYAELRLSRTNTGFTTSGTGTWHMVIDGNSTSLTASRTLTYNSNTFIIGHSARVSHNTDGTKTISISVTGGIPSTSYTETYGSGTAILDTIPRASQPTLNASSADMGTSIVINTNRVSSSFTHTLSYSFGSSSGTIAEGVGTSVSWAIPIALTNQIPNSISGNCIITCKTYSNSILIGTKTANLILTVPPSIVPSFTTISRTELNAAVDSAIGKFVQMLSNIRLSITGAAGAYSSTITGYTIAYNGTNYNSSTIDTGTIGWHGDLSVTGKVTDSRGRTASKTVTLNALAYNVPAIAAFSVQRCDEDGTENELGDCAKIVRCGSAASLLNTTEKNIVAAKVWSRPRGNSTWSELTTAGVLATSDVESGIDSMPVIISGYDLTTSYDFKLELTDLFRITTALTVLSTGTVVMSWGQTGVGIGKVWEQGALDINGDIYISGSTYIAGPTFINGNTVWNSGNDGAGSELDADTLDGHEASFFKANSVNATNKVLGRISPGSGPIEEISMSGTDDVVITGTAGSPGNLAMWNADGDIIDAGLKVRQMVFGSSNGIDIPSGQTKYIGTCMTDSAWSSSFLFTIPGTVRNLKIYATQSPGTGQTYTGTLVKDNVAQSVTCQIVEGNNLSTDSTHSFTIIPNNRVCLKWVSSSGAASTWAVFGFEFDPS